MKIIVVIVNLAVILLDVHYMSIGRLRLEASVSNITACACPIVTLIYILGFSEKSWLGAYFKRKRVEEEKRIEELEKANQGGDSPSV
jgi:hypothetical protein